MSEQGLKLVVSADVSQATKAMTDVGKAAREAGAVMTETGKAFQSSTGKIVQAGLSWNQFVGALKGPTKAAFKEATGQMLSCGEATREVAKEWALYKAAGLQVASTNNDITSTFQKLAVAQSQAAQTTPPTVSLNINEQLEAAMGRISASIDKAADEALRMGTALDQATGKADGNVNNLSTSVNKLTDNVKRVGGSAASFAQLKQSATANISLLEAQLKRLETLASMPNLSTRQYDRLNQMAAKTRAEIDRLNTSFKKYGGGTADATQATMNLSRVVQDAPYGFMGIANNLNPLLESFQRLQKDAGSTGGALKAMGASLMGPGGIGLAVGVVSSLLVVFGDKLFKSKDSVKGFAKEIEDLKQKITEFRDVTKADLLGDSSSEYTKAATSIATLHENIELAKRGFISKKEVVNQYNKELGETIGKVKTLDEVEQAVASKGDAYLKFTLLKAAAQQAMAKASAAALVAAENEAKATEIQSNVKWVDPKVVGAQGMFLYKAATDRLTKPLKEATKEANKEKDRFTQIFKDFYSEAAKIASANKFDFMQGQFDDKDIKGQVPKFNFFDKFFEVNPKTAQDRAKQSVEMFKTAMEFATKNNDIFFGLDAIIKAPDREKTIEQAKRWWADYQNGIIRFKPPVVNLEQELKMVPVVQEVDTTAIRNQFIEGLKQGDRKKVEAEDLNFIGLPSKEQILDTYKTLFAQVGDKLPKLIETAGLQQDTTVTVSVNSVVNTADLESGLKKALANAKKIKEDFKTEMNNLFKNFSADAFAGIGESIGQSIASGADVMKVAFSSIIGMMGDLITQIGKALVQYGVVKLGLDKILKGGIAIPGTLAIAAGVMAIAIGQLVKASTPKAFADGGLVYGPALGLVGEGRGTSRANPEIIAPLDKLKNYMNGGMGGSVNVSGEFRMRGNDLVAVVARTNKLQSITT